MLLVILPQLAVVPRHLLRLAEDVIQEAEKNGYQVRTREGGDGSTWILVDLNEIIVHIFTEDARLMYKLENLWGDLPMRNISED
jgi:ribosome-associated protein